MRPARPSAALAAHVLASLLGLALAVGFTLAAVLALAHKGAGAGLAFAVLAVLAQGARPGPRPDLDKESGL